MGMDVFGTAPTDPVGEYFRRTVWGWHPLIDLTQHVCEIGGVIALFNRCEHWHTNDGDGLGAEDAKMLGDLIDKAVKAGLVDTYVANRLERLKALPDEPCKLCKSTGIRDDAVGQKDGMTTRVIPPDAKDLSRGPSEKPHPRAGQTGWCNACDGRGHSAPFELNYGTSAKSAEEWAAFLKHCGGFEIC